MFAGALAEAVRSHPDLHFGLYFSLFEWFNPLYLQDKANNFTTQTYVKVPYRSFTPFICVLIAAELYYIEHQILPLIYIGEPAGREKKHINVGLVTWLIVMA